MKQPIPHNGTEPLKVGDAAPVVSAVTDAGETLNLGDVYAKNTYTVVWFYPKALTGGCTKQGCSLRDASAELTRHGAAVVGDPAGGMRTVPLASFGDEWSGNLLLLTPGGA